MQIHELSIPKSELDPETASNLLDTRNVANTIARNVATARQAPYVRERKGIFEHENVYAQFSLTGALQVASLDLLGPFGKEFFLEKSGRYHIGSGEKKYNLRGLRYTVAIDPNLSPPQKLHQLYEDYTDGINVLSRITELPEQQYLQLAPILDYIKMVAVTTFNGYTYGEKNDKAPVNDEEYQLRRKRLAEYMSKTVRAYFLSLVDSVEVSDLQALLDPEGQEILTTTINGLIQEYRQHNFSSNFIVRPESTHPLTMMGTSYLAVQNYPNTDTVIGLPAGSTELASVVAYTYEKVAHKQVDLVLLPFSLHSIKNKSGNSHNINQQAAIHAQEITGKNVLIVDDNTSTGRTLQQVSFVIAEAQPRQLDWIVSEADIIRSKIDQDRVKRTHIANPELYNSAIAILPVSRSVRPKYDLKELMEQRQLAKHYKKRLKKQQAFPRELNMKYLLRD